MSNLVGIQANRVVFNYGLRLLPALYEVYNPMRYEAAHEMEVAGIQSVES